MSAAVNRSLIPYFPSPDLDVVDKDSLVESLESVKEKLQLPSEDLARRFLHFFSRGFSSKVEGSRQLTLASLGLTYMGMLNILPSNVRDEWYSVCDHPRLLQYLALPMYDAPDTSKIYGYNSFRANGDLSAIEGIDVAKTSCFCYAVFSSIGTAVRHKGGVLHEG